MWDLYANGPAAVAIRSTIGKLKRVLVNSPGPVHIGRVGYLDWATTNTWPNSLFGMLVRGKGHAYRHEQEVRLTFWIEEVGWQDYLPKETASRPIVLDRLAEIIGEILAAGLPFPSESETEIRNLASR